MCERIVKTNHITIVKLTHSTNGHFQQFFIAHAISIQGFAMRCRPTIAIDSSHMNGSYGGVLFSAIIYDANDSISPLAFGVMSSENYEDWLWFENLKTVVGDREVVIISDRYHALLHGIPKIFGAKNHA